MTLHKYRILTLLTCVGMFLVLIAGVLVTNTESQAGCGTDWPLCNGKFIPAYTLESLVEYSHRLISGGVGLLVGAAFLATVLWKPAKRKEPVWYASAALFFTVLQAALGAMAVKWPQSDAVLALHFGISLFAFTSTWLLYTYASRLASSQGQPVSVAADGKAAGAVPRSVYHFALVALIYCYAVIYLGAYIRHTGSGGACVGWPLCNGDVIPELSGSVGVAFAHRLAAVLMLLLVVALVRFIRKKAGAGTELGRIARQALLLVCLQVLSGGLLAITIDDHDVYVFTALLHTVIIAALFSVICLLALRSRHLSGNRSGT
ncbi:heme A synthase [Cohnella sp. CFH 77786]|uniref:COX15/CtaA family protein n=1 Tax=Cohnella sp. CFH 77786 TaxID=2662265 RepID=UPI001C610E62|nr:COX15/CtaA family protein [Cohnella sp. CFH 77786]MBW5447275.1 heme A synthase [Cohnella sp. CFH 77786]